MQRSRHSQSYLWMASVLMLASALPGQMISNLDQGSMTRQLRTAANAPWLDPQRFMIQHGFSFSLASGAGIASGPVSMGVYTNQMRYLINEKLILNSLIHLVQPSVLDASPLGRPNLQMYYQANLDWRISDRMTIQLGFANTPPLRRYSPYSPYGLGHYSAFRYGRAPFGQGPYGEISQLDRGTGADPD